MFLWGAMSRTSCEMGTRKNFCRLRTRDRWCKCSSEQQAWTWYFELEAITPTTALLMRKPQAWQQQITGSCGLQYSRASRQGIGWWARSCILFTIRAIAVKSSFLLARWIERFSEANIGVIHVTISLVTNWCINCVLMRVMDAVKETLHDVSSVSSSSFALTNG